jgi:hypothetical protein
MLNLDNLDVDVLGAGFNDANLGVDFDDDNNGGLRLSSSATLNPPQPAQLDLEFVSIAPTIEKVGFHLSAFTDGWRLDFDRLRVPEIENDGTMSSSFVDLDPTNNAPVAFQPLFEITPGAEFDDATPPKEKVYLAQWTPDPPNEGIYSGARSHILFYTVLVWGFYKCGCVK